MTSPQGSQLPGSVPSAPTTAPSNPATTRSTATTTPMAASEMKPINAKRIGITPTLRYRQARREKATAGSASLRLHQIYGESPATWENRMYGTASVYRRVAQINGALRVLGLVDKLTELMLPVELSLGPEGVLPLPEALHAAELADCREQEADESFRYKLSQGLATVADAREYLRLSAMQCARAEVARREVSRWLEQQRVEP